MKAVEKRKLNKAQLATVWLLIISVILIAAYVTVIAVVNKLASNNGSSGSGKPDVMEGEGTYLNQLVEQWCTILTLTADSPKYSSQQ